MIEYSNEQAQYNIDEQEHKNTEVDFTEYLDSRRLRVHPIKGLIKVISIKNTVQAHCCNQRSFKLQEITT